MSHSILTDNERKRLDMSLPWLLCFALFTAWQVGVFSYSGAALAVAGRLPLGMAGGNLMPLIVAGYLISIGYMLIFPRRIVWAERVLACLALVSAAALYLPLPSLPLILFFLVQLLCCCVMIGFETALMAGLFSDRCVVKHLFATYGIIFIIAAFMQNQFFEVPYGTFKIFNVIALVLQLAFYCKLPAKVWPEYVRKGTDLVCPRRLFAGLFALCFLGNIMFSFGVSAAEGIEHGVFVFYLSFSAFAIGGYGLLRRFRLSPLRIVFISIVVSVAGFIFAIIALYAPALALPACVFLGPSCVPCFLTAYYGLVMTKRYPSRFITPVMIGISFAASVLILGVLIEAFRDNTALLYTVYLAIAVALAVLYLAVEPYLLYSFRSRRLISEEGIGEIAGQEAGENESAVVCRAETKPAEPVPAELSMAEPALTEQPLTARQRNLAANAFDKLSSRELAIAEMMMQGFRYADICKRLNIKKTTAYWYRNQLFDKLQVGSVREMIALAEKREPPALVALGNTYAAPSGPVCGGDNGKRLLIRRQE
jgi:DNA-binding NarL/FixJ family response regulator